MRMMLGLVKGMILSWSQKKRDVAALCDQLLSQVFLMIPDNIVSIFGQCGFLICSSCVAVAAAVANFVHINRLCGEKKKKWDR